MIKIPAKRRYNFIPTIIFFLLFFLPFSARGAEIPSVEGDSQDQTSGTLLVLVSTPNGQLSKKEDAIQKEFDCLRQKNGKTLEWADVCYSSANAQARAEIINQALDSIDMEEQDEDSPDADDSPSVDYGSEYQQNSYSPMMGEMIHETDPDSDVSDVDSDQFETLPSSQENPDPLDFSAPSPKKLISKKHQFTFGPEVFLFHYKEPDLTVDDQGVLFGFFTQYEFRPDKDEQIIEKVINMYKLDARFAYGQVDYSSDPSGTIDDIDDYSIEFRGAGGYDMFLDARTRVTPYAGLGFRYLFDGLGGRVSSLNQYGYDRASHYLYAPLGVDFLAQLHDQWQFGFNLEGDLFLWGRQDSYLSQVNPTTYADIRNRQRNGFGLRGSLKLVKKSKSIDLLIEPFIRYWHIQDSDLAVAVSNGNYVTSGQEPNNNTSEIGVKLGFQY